MNIVFAWLVLAGVVFLLSFGPPAFLSYDNLFGRVFWDHWRTWNVLLWGLVGGSALVSWGIVWSLGQLGVL